MGLKWTYWPGCVNTVPSCPVDGQEIQNLLSYRYFDMSKAPPAFSCLEKLFGIAYNSYITKCSRIISKPNLISFSEHFYQWKSWNLRQLRLPSILFWVLITKNGLFQFPKFLWIKMLWEGNLCMKKIPTWLYCT